MRRSSFSCRAPAIVVGAILACAGVARAQDDVPPAAAPADPAGAPSAPAAPPPAESLPMLEGGTVAVRPETDKRGEVVPPSVAGQRYFGIFATGLNFNGFGLGVRGGSRVGVDLSFGWSPIVATWVPENSQDFHLKILSSFQFNASVFWAFYRAGSRTDLGIMLAYKYNTLVQHGVGAAFYAQYDLGEHWALHFVVGPAIFPAAEDRMRKEANWPSSGLLSSGLSWLQGGTGIAIAFFP